MTVTVVSSLDITEFTEQINQLLLDGWELRGHMIVVWDKKWNKSQYSQMLVFYKG